jgi:hypothetical protein
MKKTGLVFGVIGLGAGFLYFLSRNGRKSGASISEDEASTGSKENRNGKPVQERPRLVRQQRNASGARAEGANVRVDDQGTDQSEAINILKQIRDAAFDSDDQKLAIALGRPAEEIEAWTSGAEIVDGDVLMKARGLAIERGVQL